MNLPVPPLAVRRLVIAPLIWLGGGALLLFVIPLWVFVVTALLLVHPTRWRVLRVGAFAMVYLAVEVVGVTVAFALWVLGGFGLARGRPRWDGWIVDRHYGVLRVTLGVLMAAARRLFSLDVVVDGERLPVGGPGELDAALIVMSRHAGPGDSFLLVHEMVSWAGLRPRIVLKETLRLDPLIDVVLGRLPCAFVPGAAAAGVLDRIAELSSTMGPDDALLIFPEGGNFTASRRSRLIERFRDSGRAEVADRAEALRHLLLPRVGGVGAALRANPDATVIVVAHTGLDDLVTPADLWDCIPHDKTVWMRWSVVPDGEIPLDDTGLEDWMFATWRAMDSWVNERSATATG